MGLGTRLHIWQALMCACICALHEKLGPYTHISLLIMLTVNHTILITTLSPLQVSPLQVHHFQDLFQDPPLVSDHFSVGPKAGFDFSLGFPEIKFEGQRYEVTLPGRNTTCHFLTTLTSARNDSPAFSGDCDKHHICSSSMVQSSGTRWRRA